MTTSQPQGYSIQEFNQFVFNNLNANISFQDDFQRTISQSDVDDAFINELLDPSTSITPSLAPSYYLNEPLFPDGELYESELVYLDDEGPVNEVTITTTPSDAKNEQKYEVNGAPPEFNLDEYKNMTPDQIENQLIKECEQISLKNIDESIEDRTIYFEVEPPNSIRHRYGSDGKRQITKARTKPAVVRLPSLKNIDLNPDTSFSLRLGLITHDIDPLCIHPNKLEYHSDDAQEFSDGTICVPLTPEDIDDEQKELSRLSITKTLLGAYKSQLAPFSPTGADVNLHKLDESTDKGEEEKISVKEAKVIFKNFNLKASRIVCQLLIEQKESFRCTDIICQTHVIEEKPQSRTAKKQSATKKRSRNSYESDDEESIDERPSSSKSKSSKRPKRSN